MANYDNSFFSKYFEENNSKNISDFDYINNPKISKDYFEILGLKLHFDDILLICLIFFLYKEDVHDEFLFLVLILLLLS